MLEWMRLPAALLIACALLFLVTLVIETLYVLLLRSSPEKEPLADRLYALSLLPALVVCVFLVAMARDMAALRYADLRFDALRFLFLLPCAAAVWSFVRRPRLASCANAALWLIQLPLWNAWGAGILHSIYPLCCVFLFLSVLREFLKLIVALSAAPGALDVKEALDRLPDGLLFADEKGRVLLMNNAMDALLRRVDVSVLLSAPELLKALDHLPDNEERTLVSVANGRMLRFRNGGSYLITQSSFSFEGRSYSQLLAADVTEEDLMTTELSRYTAELARTQKQLTETLSAAEAMEREKELLRLKYSVHDVIGQRLSILHRFLEDMDEGRLSVEQLKALLYGLDEELRRSFSADVGLRLNALSSALLLIHVTLTVEGTPPDIQNAAVLLSILREAATNAVRHGAAKRIRATFAEDENAYTLRVENDGALPAVPIREGDGIRGMRMKLALLGGDLRVEPSPVFCLHITLHKARS